MGGSDEFHCELAAYLRQIYHHFEGTTVCANDPKVLPRRCCRSRSPTLASFLICISIPGAVAYELELFLDHSSNTLSVKFDLQVSTCDHVRRQILRKRLVTKIQSLGHSDFAVYRFVPKFTSLLWLRMTRFA